MTRAADPPQSTPLSVAIDTLDGSGPTRAKQFHLLDVHTLDALIHSFPRTYQRERAECAIRDLVPEQIQIARGEVVAVDYIPARPRPRFEATLQDETGKLSLVWWNGAYLRK